MLAFVSGLENSKVRQRLLETGELTLDQAMAQAEVLERAEENALDFQKDPSQGVVAVAETMQKGTSEL